MSREISDSSLTGNPYSACILVGGKASRLGTLAANLPKCLLPIYGVPFLQLLLNKLYFEGCEKIILAAGHLSTVIEDFVNKYFRDRDIEVIVETNGTGQALLMATKVLKDQEDLLCMNGDTILDLSYNAVVDFHRSSDTVATIVTTHLHNLPTGGDVQISFDNRVYGFYERESPGETVSEKNQLQIAANCGCYCFNASYVARFIEDRQAQSLEREVLPQLVRDTTVMNYDYRNLAFLDFGTPSRLHALPELLPLTEINRIYHTNIA